MADDRIDVAIGVESGEAEAGADAAAGAMLKAVQGIQQQLEHLTAVSQQNSTAMAASFDRMAAAAQQSGTRMAASIHAAAGVVDDYGNQVVAASRRAVQASEEEAAAAEKAGHSAVGARREMLVIFHELATGNYKRALGSLMVLGERMDWMSAIMSPMGAAIGTVAASMGAVAVAALEGSSQIEHLNQSLILTGNYAGITQGQFIKMGDAIASDTGEKITTVREALMAVIATGRFTGTALQPVTEAIISIARASGQSAADVVKSFEKMDNGVHGFASDLNQQMHFATAAQLEYIRTLEIQGEKEEAETEVANLVLAKQREVAQQLGFLPSILHTVTEEASKMWDALENNGRPLTIDEKIDRIRKGIAEAKKNGSDMANVGQFQFAPLPDAEQQLQDAIRRRDAKENQAAQQARDEQVQQKGAHADDLLREQEKALGGSKGLADAAVKQFRDTIAADMAAADATARATGAKIGSNYSEWLKNAIANQPAYEEQIRKSNDRQDFKRQPGQVTVGNEYSQQNAQTQAQLASLRESLKEQQDELDRSYKMNEVSLQGYYAQRLQITLTGMKAEADAVQKELDQTKALEGQAQNPAQRMSLMTKEIELQGRLTVMEQQRAHAVQQSAQEQLQAEEQLADQLQQLADRRAQSDLQAADQRALMVGQRQVQQGQMTEQQLLAMEAQFNEQETSQEIQALTQRLQTESNLSIEAKAQMLNQVEQLQQQFQTKQLQIAQQANQQQVQQAQQATQSIEEAFASSFAKFADGTEKGRTAFTNFISQIDSSLTQMVSKDLFNKLFQMPFGEGQGSSISGMLGKGMSFLFGGGSSGGATGQTVALTANTTSLDALTAQITALIATLQAQIASGSSGGGGGLNGVMSTISSLFGGGQSGSNAYGFTMPDGSSGSIMPANLGGNSYGFTMPDPTSIGYAVGTPYIPNDQLAMLHQGEAVIPAHLNSTNSSVSVVNQFSLPGGTDLRTQSQIAAMAGAGIRAALRRNG